MAPRKKGIPKKDPAIKLTKELGPFDFINAVSFDKTDLIRNADSPEATEKLYNPFLTNRALSYHISSIMDASMMNQCSHIDKALQFHCHLHSVRKEKRFSSWYKKDASDNLEMVCKFYECNRVRGMEILSLLPASALEEIKAMQETGGVKK
jgi:hypothetical protein